MFKPIPRCLVPFNMLALLVFCRALGNSQEVKPLPKDMKSSTASIVNWEEKLNSRGAKAELREVKRGEKDGKLIVAYEFYVTGTPTDQSYAIFQLPITQTEPTVVLPQVFLSKDGKVCVTNVAGCPTPVQLGFLPGKGEPFRFVLISKNGKTKAAVMIVPNPILATDQGCSVEVIRGTAKFEAAIIRGKGFKPNDEIKLTSNSAGEMLELTQKVDSNGEFILVLAPFVKGKDKGSDEVTFKAAGCAPTVAYKWGTTED